MEQLVAIAMLALSLFGPDWSSEHKAFWEWKLGHPLEGYQEFRLSRGWSPYGGGPLLGNDINGNVRGPRSAPQMIECYCEYNLDTGTKWCDCPAPYTTP